MKLSLSYKTNYHDCALEEFSKGDSSRVPASCKLFSSCHHWSSAGSSSKLELDWMDTWMGTPTSPQALWFQGKRQRGAPLRDSATKICSIQRARWARDLQPGDKWHEKTPCYWWCSHKVKWFRFWAKGLVKILKLKFRQDLRLASFFLLMFCRGYKVESWSRFWTRFRILS